jgi:hypothetical protein
MLREKACGRQSASNPEDLLFMSALEAFKGRTGGDVKDHCGVRVILDCLLGSRVKDDWYHCLEIVARVSDLNIGNAMLDKLLTSDGDGAAVDGISNLYTVYELSLRVTHLGVIALVPEDRANGVVSRIDAFCEARKRDYLIKEHFEVAMTKVASRAEFFIVVGACSNRLHEGEKLAGRPGLLNFFCGESQKLLVFRFLIVQFSVLSCRLLSPLNLGHPFLSELFFSDYLSQLSSHLLPL